MREGEGELGFALWGDKISSEAFHHGNIFGKDSS